MRIGLISDTHMPDRCVALPERAFAALADVDLLLHAGDLGELWVLDRLSAVAPIIAVHGNDDTADAQTALPYSVLLTIRGTRVLLCHSHSPDRSAELASRAGDDWEPKLAVRATQAQSCGASIYVFGHMHIPLVREVQGVLLVNPGAIASGNHFSRQLVQSVATITLREGTDPVVEHARIDEPGNVPAVDWDRGFAAALTEVSGAIVSPEVGHAWAQLRKSPADRDAFLELLRPLAHRRWAGDRSMVSADELVAAARQSRATGFRDRLVQALAAPAGSHSAPTG